MEHMHNRVCIFGHLELGLVGGDATDVTTINLISNETTIMSST